MKISYFTMNKKDPLQSKTSGSSLSKYSQNISNTKTILPLSGKLTFMPFIKSDMRVSRKHINKNFSTFSVPKISKESSENQWVQKK
jgi:hypothetical protein